MIEFEMSSNFSDEFETTLEEKEIIIQSQFSDLTEEWFLGFKEIDSSGDIVDIQGFTVVSPFLPILLQNNILKGNFIVVPKSSDIKDFDTLESFENFFFLYLTEDEMNEYNNKIED